MQDYNDTRREVEQTAQKRRRTSSRLPSTGEIRRQNAEESRNKSRLNDLLIRSVLAGTIAIGTALSALPVIASTYTGESQKARITVENNDDGAEAAAAGAGASPLPPVESAAGRPPEVTTAVTETQRITETLRFLPLTITTHVTGTITLNGKLVGPLSAGSTITSELGMYWKGSNLEIPLSGGKIATIPVRNNNLAGALTIAGGEPVTVPVEQEERPIGSAIVLVEGLNVRSNDEADSPIIGNLSAGSRLTVLEVIDDPNGEDKRLKIAFETPDGTVVDGYVAYWIDGKKNFTTELVLDEVSKEFGTGGPVAQETNVLLVWWERFKKFVGWDDNTKELVIGPDGKPVAVRQKDTGEVIATVSPAPATALPPATATSPTIWGEPEFVVTMVVETPKKSEYEIPSWYQGVETNLQVTNGEFVLSDEVESSGYFLAQIKKVLADQQGITVEDLDEALEQSGGITTLDLVLRGTNNPEKLQGVYPPSLRRGETAQLDLTEMHFETSDDPFTLPQHAKFGSYFETVQDATAGQGKPDWVAYYIDENDQLHVVLNKTMLESMTETSRETLFSRQQVKDRVAKFGVTQDQYWKDVNNQKGEGPAQRVTQLFEIIGRYKFLPENKDSEQYDPLKPGGAQLKFLLWNNAPAGEQGTPIFPLTDRENLVVSYDNGESPTDIPGYYEKDYRLTFRRN